MSTVTTKSPEGVYDVTIDPVGSRMTVYDILSDIDVSKLVKKKGQFDYLPWARAWDELLKEFPESQHEIVEFDGLPYLKTEVGYFVKTSVTVKGLTRTQTHPVLSYNNKPQLEPTCFDINTAHRRCLAKNVGLFGLGLHLYFNEEFEVPTGDYSESEKQDFDQAIEDQDGLTLVCLRNDMGMQGYINLYNSFPRGKKVDMKAEVQRLEQLGLPVFMNILDALNEAIEEAQEYNVRELWDELTKRQKAGVWKDLNETNQANLKKLLEMTADENE